MDTKEAVYLVTAATGNIGRNVVQSLLRSSPHARVRATVHDPTKAEFFSTFLGDKEQESRLSLVSGFDYNNEESVREAVKGVSGIFLNFPDWAVDKRQATRALAKVLEENKAKPLVVRLWTGTNPIWGLSEEALRLMPMKDFSEEELRDLFDKAGIPYVLLSAAWFHQNFVTYYGTFIQKGGVIPLPAGDATLPYIDTRDIGQVAARVLLHAYPYENHAVYYLASGSYSYTQIAQILSNEVGREIKYVDTDGPIKEAYGALGLAQEMVDFYKFESLISGKMPLSDPSQLEELLGRKPLSFLSFVQENRNAFLSQEI